MRPFEKSKTENFSSCSGKNDAFDSLDFPLIFLPQFFFYFSQHQQRLKDPHSVVIQIGLKVFTIEQPSKFVVIT